MLRNTPIALIVLVLILAPATAVRADEVIPKGLGGSIFVGGYFCIPNEEIGCDHLDPSFGLSAAGLYRFMDYLAANVSIFYGINGLSAVTNMDHYGVLGSLYAYLPFHSFDVFAELGVGWSEYRLEHRGSMESQSGLTMGFGIGIEYRMRRWVGISFSTRYLLPFYNEVCYYDDPLRAGPDGPCIPLDNDKYTPHGLMVGVSATFYLPQ